MIRTITAGLWWLALVVGLSAQNPPVPAAAPAKTACRGLGPQRAWNETAQFVAGMSDAAYREELSREAQAAWTAYSRSMQSDWTRLRRRHLDPLGNWRNRALARQGSGGVALYPFSGPDAANVLAFFPDAREYVLMGLEPAGCVPAAGAGYSPEYFPDLRASLQTAVAIGFFKTEDMRREFRESQVRGVLPLLLVMLARSGYSIDDVTAEGITPEGAVAPAATPGRREIRGIAIRFRDDRHGARTLRYFSVNLENASLGRKPGTVKYLENLEVHGTLLKSASYLMHKRFFSSIRGVILARSQVVVEDDSGVPFRWFDRAGWDVRVYGTYSKPIPLFANSYQEDLEAAYASAKDVEPLEFGIGYRWQPKQSNLIVAIRRAR